ncbi:outer membrane beta-barrel protein [Parerythrobacter aurantius]|uniref:outer membrane protein n=1 Tax=Parerythrobacter aurantius TaxID=3127706 RepID=UPI00324D3567
MKTSVAALAIATSVSAAAQDSEGPYFDGFYVGGHISLDSPTSNNGDVTFDTNRDGEYGDVVRTTTGANAFGPGFCDGAAFTAVAADGCANDDDDLGYGIRLGYDTRIAPNFVGGILLEGTKSDMRDYTTAFSSTPANYVFTRELDYAISARGRLGFSPGDGRGLFYLTGGASYAKMDLGFSTSNGANSFTVSDDGEWVLGGQVGGGAELALNRNLSIGIEYLYNSYDAGDAFVEVGPGTAGPTNPFLLVSGGTNMRPAETDLNFHSLRATANFRF